MNFMNMNKGRKNILVKGRLKKNVSFWCNIGTCSFILDIIENVHKMPLISLPSRTLCKIKDLHYKRQSLFLVLFKIY